MLQAGADLPANNHHRCRRKARPKRLFAATGVALAFGAACAAQELGGDCDSAQGGTVRLETFWEALGNDGKWLRVLVDTVAACNKSLTLQTESMTQTELDGSLLSRTHALHLIAGGKFQDRTPCRRDGQETAPPKLQALTPGDGSGLGERPFHPAIMELTKCGDTVYALPVGIHRVNNIYVNTNLLPRFKACMLPHQDKPKEERAAHAQQCVDQELGTLGKLTATLEEISSHQNTMGLIALAEDPARGSTGTAKTEFWPSSLLLFENIMVSVLGPAQYEAFWSGASPEQARQQMTQTLDAAEEIKPYLTRTPLSRQQAIAAVVDGTALLTVMGDWAAPQEDSANHVVSAAFPGTSKTLVYTVDLVGIPRTTPDVDLSRAFLRAATSLTAQKQGAKAKGFRSPRLDMGSPFEGMAKTARSLTQLVPHLRMIDAAEYAHEWLRADQRDDDDLVEYVYNELCRMEAAKCNTPPAPDAGVSSPPAPSGTPPPMADASYGPVVPPVP